MNPRQSGAGFRGMTFIAAASGMPRGQQNGVPRRVETPRELIAGQASRRGTYRIDRS